MATNFVAPTNWTCDAPIPNARTNKRAPCGASNAASARKCTECGAPRQSDNKSPNKNPSKDTKMSNPSTSTVKPASASVKPAPTVAKPHATPTPAATPAVSTDKSDVPKTDKPKKENENPRLVFMSTKENSYHARVRQSLVKLHGVPKDPWGVEMIPATTGSGVAVGDKPSKKVERAAAKEAEAKLMANMSDNEKLAYAKAKREKNQAEKDAKKKADRDKLRAELLAEIEAEERSKGDKK